MAGGGLRNLSIRGGRKEYAGRFSAAIAEFHAATLLLELLRADEGRIGAYSSRWQRLPAEVIALIAEFLFPGRSALVA